MAADKYIEAHADWSSRRDEVGWICKFGDIVRGPFPNEATAKLYADAVNDGITHHAAHDPAPSRLLAELKAVKADIANFERHIRELPDDTDKCTHLKLVFNSAPGEDLLRHIK